MCIFKLAGMIGSMYLHVFHRNNLTVLDAILVTGQGGKGDMRFGNKRIGSAQPLLFELSEKHLVNCEQGKNQYLLTAPVL